MKSFDAFARPVQEFQVKTTCGGYISVASICLVVTLFLTELRYFLTLESRDEMLIDQNQDQKYLNISLDMTFKAAPCSVLHINLLDPKKGNVMHVVHEIYKTRLSQSGQTIGTKLRDSLANIAQTPAEVKKSSNHQDPVKATHATSHMRCPSCFQSHIDEDDCCSTCERVREEFRQRGWNDKPDDYVFGQCVAEVYQKDPPQVAEGCRMQAMLHVRKVPAVLHIGIAKHFDDTFVNPGTQNLEEFTASLDFSHTISGLAFGPDFPGLTHVLTGRHKSEHKDLTTEHFQYDIHVIPTRYQEDGQDEVASHQYSVTEYTKPVDNLHKHPDAAAAGLWMTYDFTPFEVRVTRTRKSIFHFLTECCAILGGIFAFSGMLDNITHQLTKSAGSSKRSGVLDM
jgi:endoplasmic reticulum-Golgi intermediate compartment protein 3